MTTPARRQPNPVPARPGPRGDGTDEYVAALLEHAEDRRPLSDELALSARTWPERFHLDRGRTNLLRPLRFPASAAVLEVGAGSGALTAYLAGTCGLVDAFEVNPLQAIGARSRTRGLGDVEVFVGGIQDVPDEPAYDVVVAVGAVADAEFLKTARRRLRDGGSLVLAVENRIGVRYLSGSPDPQSGTPWAGVNGAVPMVSRGHLLRSLAEAGFQDARVLNAFPDFQITRTLLADELFREHPRLARSLPQFPSPDRLAQADRPIDEAVLWGELVDSGAGHAHGNSFLVIAGTDLWPADRLAAFFNTDRARAFCSEGSVAAGKVRRSPIAPETAHGVSVVEAEEPFLDLPIATEEIVRAPELTGELLRGWRALVETRAADLGPRLWDLVPQNLLVGASELTAIDLEWAVAGCGPADVLARGALTTADRIAATSPADGRKVADVVTDVVNALDLTDFSLTAAIAREAEFQAIRQLGRADQDSLRRRTGELREAWQVRLNQLIG